MRKLKSFSPIFLLASFMIWGFGCTEINKNAYSGHNSFFYNDSVFEVVNHDGFKIDSISELAKEINRIEVTQNGVCDTCVTGYQSAIIENRKVAEQLSEQTAILQKKVITVQRQIQKVDSIISNNDVQLSHLRAINMMSRREKTKQRNEFYALTKGD